MKIFTMMKRPNAITACLTQTRGLPACSINSKGQKALLLMALVACIGTGVEASSITWGAASTFAVLGSSTVTSVNTTTIVGDLGVSPGMAITGSPIVIGTIHANDATAVQAHADATIVHTVLMGLVATQNLTGLDLGGRELAPGVYKFNAAAALTGTLTLSGKGEYVFQIASTLTTASASAIILSNGATWEDVVFTVGTSATLGTGTDFNGNIIAAVSDTLTAGATVNGRVIAINGAVTLDNNYVVIPEPSSVAFLLAGVIVLAIKRRALVAA